MTFEFSISRPAPQPFAPPAWCADIHLDVRLPPHETVEEGISIETEAVTVEGRVGKVLVWPSGGWQALYPQTISKNGSVIPIRVPLTREIVQAIESERGGTGPVTFKLQLAVRFRRIRQAGPAYNAPTAASKSETANGSIDWVVHRDPWKECLQQLGWKEIEIFEVKTGPEWHDANLAAALGELHSAENLLRFGGDPKVVLGKCYEALETAAKYAVQGEEKKKGFAILLDKAFPNEPDKAEYVDTVIAALNKFAHLARHGAYPVRHISQAEARFALKETLAVFELLGNNNT
jgi:hypothetical protein